jgi:hypothetical protein
MMGRKEHTTGKDAIDHPMLHQIMHCLHKSFTFYEL